MKNQNHDQVIGIPVTSVGYAAGEMPGKPASGGLSKYHPSFGCSLYRQSKYQFHSIYNSFNLKGVVLTERNYFDVQIKRIQLLTG